MARTVEDALPRALVERLAQRDVERRLGVALPLVTLDAEGRPHPMLLSYLEVRAYDARTLGLVIGEGSTSARNLAARKAATLLVVEPDVVFYVKARALDGPIPVEDPDAPGLAFFLLEVEQVLEDVAADREAGTGIVSPMRYAPVPALDTRWVQATLAALASPRARA